MKTTSTTIAGALSVLAICASACGGASGAAGKSTDPRDVTVGGAKGALPGAMKACEGKPSGDLDAEKAEGLRIVEVCVTGAPADTTEAVRRAMHLRADSKLTAEALRGDLAAAYATGRLDDVEASAKSAGPGSAVLLVTVKERPRVAEVKLEGFDGAGRGAPADAFAKQGAPLDIPKLEAAEKKVRETLVEDGWDDAKLTHEITLERGGRVHLMIRLVEGPRAKVGKVTFEGARADLAGGLRKAVELDEGAPLSPDRVERAGLLVSAFYYDRGFLTVKVDTPKKTRAADGATAIAFPIVEGPVFKIGKLVAKSGDAGVEKDVMAKVKTKPGEIFSRSKLVTDLEAIRAMLKERGKPSATVEPETDLDPKKGVVDITLRISGTWAPPAATVIQRGDMPTDEVSSKVSLTKGGVGPWRRRWLRSSWASWRSRRHRSRSRAPRAPRARAPASTLRPRSRSPRPPAAAREPSGCAASTRAARAAKDSADAAGTASASTAAAPRATARCWRNGTSASPKTGVRGSARRPPRAAPPHQTRRPPRLLRALRTPRPRHRAPRARARRPPRPPRRCLGLRRRRRRPSSATLLRRPPRA